MSGIYFTSSNKRKIENAIYNPSAAHSLNLVGCHGSNITKKAIIFFLLA